MKFARGGSTPMIDDEERAQRLDIPPERRDRAQFVRGVFAALLAVAIVLVALDNRRDVRLGYVFGDAEVPVWVAMVVAALAGVLIGWLLQHRPRHRQR